MAKKSLAISAVNAAGIDISEAEAGVLLVRLSGDWKLKSGLPPLSSLEKQFDAANRPRRLSFEATQLGEWDSGLLAFLVGLQEICRAHEVQFDAVNLPEGARRLVKLAIAVPERQGARRTEDRQSFLTLVGKESLTMWRSGGEMLEFLGQAIQSFGRLAVGRARFRRSDLVDIIFECGAAALPIVTLISFLVGMILGFVGAIQLEQFGAQIYIADLVGIAMARVMGALMTAIVLAGRTGAAFAAQLGTMQVNEEIDALATFGLSPMEFLVLPRMIALILMMPVLCIYADLMGILGGALVGVGMLGLSVTQYVNETIHGIRLMNFAIGIFTSSIFGVIVAICGCMRGIQSGRSASAVGQAATSAVVTAIIFIVVTEGVVTALTSALGI